MGVDPRNVMRYVTRISDHHHPGTVSVIHKTRIGRRPPRINLIIGVDDLCLAVTMEEVSA